ncbi:hypothetical protein [Actinomadura sp. HBU206391]|uniref:hypothetical protein n=1 Tax=Actinomadura sp. HBU206391 TaxID=2731692 RepID=UPI0016504011|nr:hypothetical protein [Actinomadura sp. HBU206391]MBC6462997.1 hypothetical protein [Actinomadura sp. HBU206391]
MVSRARHEAVLIVAVAVALVCTAAVTVIALSEARGAATAGGWTISSSGRYRPQARIVDIAAVGGSDVWAVGAESVSEEPLSYGVPVLTHWDGARWTRVAPQTLPLPYGELNGISMVSGSEVWATGRLGPTAGEQRGPYVLRHDGMSWGAVPVTGLPQVGHLLPAAVRGRTWMAVAGSPVVATYTGKGWRAESLGEHVRISSITARSEDDAWVVGDRLGRAYAAHWDGGVWEALPPPTGRGVILSDVHAASATEVWAVGGEFGVNRPVLLHWDGRAWERLAVPLEHGDLSAVTAASGGRVWVAGTDRERPDRPLILRSAGRRWTKSYGPVPSGTDHVSVNALTRADGTERVWLAGSTGGGKARWGRDLILRTADPGR